MEALQLTIYKLLGMIDTLVNKSQLLCNAYVWSPEIGDLDYYAKSQM